MFLLVQCFYGVSHACKNSFPTTFLNSIEISHEFSAPETDQLRLCVWLGRSRVVRSVLIESWEIVGPYQSWWLLNGLLLVLQVLHVIWFYLIARIAIKALFKGKVNV